MLLIQFTGCEVQLNKDIVSRVPISVLPLISVHPRDGGAAVWIKHCLSVLASMWLISAAQRQHGFEF